MGASQSQNSTDVINQTITNVITNNTNECSSNVNQNQVVNLGGVGAGNNISQTATLSLSCLQKIKMDNNLATQIATAIQQAAQASGIALAADYSSSSNTTNLSNYIQTNITTNNLQKCFAQISQNQNVSTAGYQFNNTVSQSTALITSCLQNMLAKNKVANGIVQDIKQKAKSTQKNPLNFLGNMMTDIVVIIIGVIVFVIVIALILVKGGGSNQTPSQGATVYMTSPGQQTSQTVQ